MNLIDIKIAGQPAKRYVKIIEDAVINLMNNKLFTSLTPSCASREQLDIHLVNTNNNKEIKINNNNKERKENKFVKPTIEEIKLYCIERRNKIDAEQFYHYYESKGWLIGKNHMKNWKSAIITWEQNSKKYANKPIKEPTTFNNLPLVGDNWTEEDIRKLRG